VIFSKKQLAILNLLKETVHPYEENNSDVVEKFTHELNKSESLKKAQKFFKQEESNILKDKINKRLLKFTQVI
jgi:hypothetical protein